MVSCDKFLFKNDFYKFPLESNFVLLNQCVVFISGQVLVCRQVTAACPLCWRVFVAVTLQAPSTQQETPCSFTSPQTASSVGVVSTLPTPEVIHTRLCCFCICLLCVFVFVCCVFVFFCVLCVFLCVRACFSSVEEQELLHLTLSPHFSCEN